MGCPFPGESVFAECMTVFAELRALEEEQEALAARLAELDPAGADYARVSERFHVAEGEFRARDGYSDHLYWRGTSRSNASAFLWAIFSRSSGDTGKFLRKATAAKLLPKG